MAHRGLATGKLSGKAQTAKEPEIVETDTRLLLDDIRDLRRHSWCAALLGARRERAAYLHRYRQRVLALESAPTIRYPVLADYDERYVLKARP